MIEKDACGDRDVERIGAVVHRDRDLPVARGDRCFIEPLRFVAELCAKRGRPLRAGMLITTGAITGIHDVVAGELARVEFKGLGAVQCIAAPLKARPAV